MNKQKYINEIITWLAIYERVVAIRGGINLRDINFLAENFYRDFLNKIYLLNLENLNYPQNNEDTIDLGDKKERKAYQITSSVSRRKVTKTIRGFKSKSADYDELFIVFIQPLNKLKDVVGKYKGKIKPFDSSFGFDENKNLIDNATLVKEIENLTINQVKDIYDFVQQELGQIYNSDQRLNISDVSALSDYKSIFQRGAFLDNFNFEGSMKLFVEALDEVLKTLKTGESRLGDTKPFQLFEEQNVREGLESIYNKVLHLRQTYRMYVNVGEIDPDNNICFFKNGTNAVNVFNNLRGDIIKDFNAILKSKNIQPEIKTQY